MDLWRPAPPPSLAPDAPPPPATAMAVLVDLEGSGANSSLIASLTTEVVRTDGTLHMWLVVVTILIGLLLLLVRIRATRTQRRTPCASEPHTHEAHTQRPDPAEGPVHRACK